MDFLYVFVVFGDLYNDTWGRDECRVQNAECRVGERHGENFHIGRGRRHRRPVKRWIYDYIRRCLFSA